MKELINMISEPGLAANLQILILLPLLAGLVLFIIPDKARIIKGVLSLLVTIAAGILVTTLLSSGSHKIVLNLWDAEKYLTFNIDNLSRLIIIFISLFSILINLYSIVYIKGKNIPGYYTWFLITMACSFGAVLADNLLLFLAFWGVLGITLYKLIRGNDEESSATAKKTLILIGASDSIMILGIAILWKMTGNLNMSEIQVSTESALASTAFIALLVGSFTKAGAFPFHTWVPDYAKDAPASSSAYLPASLDKLLGIYFLARIINGLFLTGEWMTLLLLTVGVTTIIIAVMMALMQHNYKQLLGYHAVSQVGYMILGLSLGSVIGIAAGLFHMVNNAIYKSGLFLTAGSVEYSTGEKELDNLGGLSKVMPMTFFASLIFALSISGVPPLNGFASKWMIYQAIIEFANGPGIANKLWILWLGLSVLGSALTLASFTKFIGGIFLGRRRNGSEVTREAPPLMWIPATFLALICILFGVAATQWIVPKMLIPVAGNFEFSGFWNSGMVSLLVLISFLLGGIIYLILNIKKFRHEDSFIGGETFYEKAGYPATEFYKTFTEFGFLSFMYDKAMKKWFDIYEVSKRLINWCHIRLSEVHTGILSSYIIWVFAGLLLMLLILI